MMDLIANITATSTTTSEHDVVITVFKYLKYYDSSRLDLTSRMDVG